MTEVDIVSAGPGDIERLLGLANQLLAEDGVVLNPNHAKALQHILSDPAIGRGWLAVDRSGDVGYSTVALCAHFDLGGSVARVDQLYVVPSFRQRGIGRLLVTRMLEDLQASDVLAVEVLKPLSDPSVVNLYGSIGFRTRPYSVLGFDFGGAVEGS